MPRDDMMSSRGRALLLMVRFRLCSDAAEEWEAER